jgi:hypothetical protein
MDTNTTWIRQNQNNNNNNTNKEITLMNLHKNTTRECAAEGLKQSGHITQMTVNVTPMLHTNKYLNGKYLWRHFFNPFWHLTYGFLAKKSL